MEVGGWGWEVTESNHLQLILPDAGKPQKVALPKPEIFRHLWCSPSLLYLIPAQVAEVCIFASNFGEVQILNQ
jgi:hypothetical protein